MLVACACRQGLEQLYAAGGRKFLVWELIAADVIPVVNHVNTLVNYINAVLDAAHIALGQKLAAEQLLAPNQFRAYVAAFVVRSGPTCCILYARQVSWPGVTCIGPTELREGL